MTGSNQHLHQRRHGAWISRQAQMQTWQTSRIYFSLWILFQESTRHVSRTSKSLYSKSLIVFKCVWIPEKRCIQGLSKIKTNTNSTLGLESNSKPEKVKQLSFCKIPLIFMLHYLAIIQLFIWPTICFGLGMHILNSGLIFLNIVVLRGCLASEMMQSFLQGVGKVRWFNLFLWM